MNDNRETFQGTKTEPEPELMPAAEARKTIDGLHDSKAAKLKREATSAIQNAVLNGISQVDLEIPYSDHDRIKTWLKSKGYKVNCGDNQKDGSWFRVNW